LPDPDLDYIYINLLKISLAAMTVQDVGQMLYIAPDSACFQHSEQALPQTSALSLSPLSGSLCG